MFSLERRDASGVVDRFYHVAARTSTDVWAGGLRGVRGVIYPLLGHWDGRRWREWQLASPGRIGAMAVLPSGEMWAPYSASADAGARGLLRWDGRRFRREKAPPSAEIDILTELVATRAGLWLHAWTPNPRDSNLFRYQDGKWASVGGTDPGRHSWEAVRGPRGDLWAHSFSPPGVARWAGRWIQTDLPRVRDAYISGLAVTSTGAAFAYGAADGQTVPLLLRWSGDRWVTASTPSVRYYERVGAVAGISPRDLWVAADRRRSTPWRLLHSDGTRWTHVVVPDRSAVGELTMAGRDLWVVGGSVLRYGCAAG